MSQKEAAVVRLERLTRGRKTMERWGKCMVAFGLSVGMLEVLEVRIGRNLLESVLLVLEQAVYKSGLPPSLPLHKNLGSDALFSM